MASTARQNELVALQSEITKEIAGDAPEIAQGVFGDNKNHPDMAQISNQRLDEVYRQAFQTDDRKFLQQEAQRDPEQFLKVAGRIGVQMPDPNAPPPPPPVAVPPPAPMPMAPPPVAPPAPMPMAPPPGAIAPPSINPAAPGAAVPPFSIPPPPQQGGPTPQLLGPNGAPIPAMAQGGIVTQPTLALIGEAGPEMVVPMSGDMSGPAATTVPSPPTVPPTTPPVSQWDDLIRQHLPDQHQDLANDPRFLRTVAAGARAESTDDPRAYQLGYKPDDPRTWNTYGGRGLWQFDINKGAKGYGVPEDQLMDPNYQASVIVPEYAQNYKAALARNPNMDDQTLAASVYGATERPGGTVGGKFTATNVPAYKNYVRAYNELVAELQQ